MREHLPFVVGRAAGIEIAVAARWFKRGRNPFVERVNGLHVVMPIDEHGRAHRPLAASAQ